jgi:hypothetical protein
VNTEGSEEGLLVDVPYESSDILGIVKLEQVRENGS